MRWDARPAKINLNLSPTELVSEFRLAENKYVGSLVCAADNQSIPPLHVYIASIYVPIVDSSVTDVIPGPIAEVSALLLPAKLVRIGTRTLEDSSVARMLR